MTPGTLIQELIILRNNSEGNIEIQNQGIDYIIIYNISTDKFEVYTKDQAEDSDPNPLFQSSMKISIASYIFPNIK